MRILNNKETRKLILKAQNYAIDKFMEDNIYVVGKEQTTFYLLLRQCNDTNYDWNYELARGGSIYQLQKDMEEKGILPKIELSKASKDLIKAFENVDIKSIVAEILNLK